MNTASETPRNPKLRGKRIVLKDGAIFEIPAPDGRLGYGVAIIGGGVPYVIILKSLHKERPSLYDLASDEIALVGWTADALIYHGRWVIVGNDYPSRKDVPFPNFKVPINDKFQTTTFRGEVIGPSTTYEIDLLDFQFSQSPIAYQKALLALHGLDDWKDHYGKLLPNYARNRMTRYLDQAQKRGKQ